ncbi:MAG: hypothetical protein QOE40_144 [Actinomycetota bacterium]|jgi:hypothetical protein|nr:hypothetical protein [Actinomycetota bacterium]
MRKLLVFLIVLGLLAVAGDRLAEKLTTDEAEQRLTAEGLSSPAVDVRGFPFLTQLLARRFDDVHVSAASVRVGPGQAERVSATARDVAVPSGGQATAGRLTARGTIAYTEVLRRVNSGLRLTDAGSGQVQLRRRLAVLGLTYDVVARGRVESRGNTLVVTPTSVRLAGGGSLDQRLSALIADRFSLSYRIRGLPEGIQIDRVRPAQDGFVVDVSGRDVRLATAAASALR